MRWPFKQQKRRLRNGEQVEILIGSLANEPNGDGWWADTCMLVHALSWGDRSTIIQAAQSFEAGDQAALMTVENTVTNDLWSRMTNLGYMTDTSSDLPDELAAHCSAHQLTGYGAKDGMLFFAAQQAQMNKANGDASLAGAFADRFATLDAFHRGLDLGMLRSLQAQFYKAGELAEVEPGSDPDKIFEAYARIGAMEADGAGQWRTTTLGALNAPFLMDRILYELGGIPS